MVSSCVPGHSQAVETNPQSRESEGPGSFCGRRLMFEVALGQRDVNIECRENPAEEAGGRHGAPNAMTKGLPAVRKALPLSILNQVGLPPSGSHGLFGEMWPWTVSIIPKRREPPVRV